MVAAELVVDAKAVLGEGPIWDHRTRTVLWVDIVGGEVHSFDPDTGVDQVIYVGADRVGCVALHVDGILMASGVRLLLLRADQSVTEVATLTDEPDGQAFNDGAVDPQGRFLAGTVRPAGDAATGRLYRFEHDGSVSVLLEGVTMSNGIDWSGDRTTMYYIDSVTGTVQVFAYGSVITKQREFAVAEMPVEPDGLCVDSKDCLWIAFFGASCVRRYDATGVLLAELELPVSLVTSCCLGGDDLNQLYVSSANEILTPEQLRHEPLAGGLFCLSPAVTGRRSNVCTTQWPEL